MTRYVLIADVGRGQEALVFPSQGQAQRWLDLHPEVDECTQGMVPVTTMSALIGAARSVTS